MHFFRTDTEKERLEKELDQFVSIKRSYVYEIVSRIVILESKVKALENS